MTTSPIVTQGLEFVARRRYGTLVVALSGELDLVSAPELERFLRDLEPAEDVVALDLTGLWFIDSSGLRVLLAENERGQMDGYRLVLVGVHGDVLDTLRLIGLDRVLPIAPALAI